MAHQSNSQRQDISASNIHVYRSGSPAIQNVSSLSSPLPLRRALLLFITAKLYQQSSSHRRIPRILALPCATANRSTSSGSIYVLKSALQPRLLAVVSARSGWILMKSTKSPTPTPARQSASLYPMASSSANKSPCTRVPGLGS